MANEVFLIIGVILLTLIIGCLLGWLISKILFNRFLKKIDKTLTKPEEIKRFNSLYKEQVNSTIAREENDGRRKRQLDGNFGNGKIKSREPRIEDTIKQLFDKGANERSDSIQDSESSKIRDIKRRDEETDRDSGEDQQKFDWAV
jgi:hypothetical protein